MKHHWMINLVFVTTLGCNVMPVESTGAEKPVFLTAASSVDGNLDKASIEDYVISLPVRAVNDGDGNDFAKRVLNARKDLPQNKGADPDYLYIGGDGSRGLISFRLDRKKRMLHVSDKSWEDENIPATTYFLYRVSGGWIQSEKEISSDILEHPEKLSKIRYWEGVGG